MLVRAMAGAAVAVVAATGLVGCSSNAPSGAPALSSSSAPQASSVSAAVPTSSVSAAAGDAARGAAGASRVPTTPGPSAVTPLAERVPPNRCAANRAAQKIIVSIRVQHMWLCAHHRLVRDNAVTTGMAGPDTRTPTGNYRIEGRNRDTTLTLNTGQTFAVKYWIPFDAPLFGFHDSSWQHFPYGSPRYRTNGSHGCIHMPLTAIAFLYRWVKRPTAVHIA